MTVANRKIHSSEQVLNLGVAVQPRYSALCVSLYLSVSLCVSLYLSVSLCMLPLTLQVLIRRSSWWAVWTATSHEFLAAGGRARRCVSLPFSPSLPLIFSYKSETFLCGAGHAAGSITSNPNGTATQYNTAADRRLLIPESIGTLTGALETVIAAPSAKEFSFHAAPGQVQSGFIADELREHIPDAVTKSALEEVDNSKLVPLLWNALKELAAETAELKGRLAAAGL